jgi:hypothetical protein
VGRDSSLTDLVMRLSTGRYPPSALDVVTNAWREIADLSRQVPGRLLPDGLDEPIRELRRQSGAFGSMFGGMVNYYDGDEEKVPAPPGLSEDEVLAIGRDAQAIHRVLSSELTIWRD